MKSYKLKEGDVVYWFSKEPVEFLGLFNVEFKDGEIAHWRKYIHREDGPAIEDDDNNKQWYANGDRHREDGPAIERSDESQSWYWRGEWLSKISSQEEFEIWKRFKNFR